MNPLGGQSLSSTSLHWTAGDASKRLKKPIGGAKIGEEGFRTRRLHNCCNIILKSACPRTDSWHLLAMPCYAFSILSPAHTQAWASSFIMRAVCVYAHPESFIAYYRCIIDQHSPKCGNCGPARRKSKIPWILTHLWFSPLILPPLADSHITPVWTSFLLMSLCPGVASAMSCTSHMSTV